MSRGLGAGPGVPSSSGEQVQIFGRKTTSKVDGQVGKLNAQASAQCPGKPYLTGTPRDLSKVAYRHNLLHRSQYNSGEISKVWSTDASGQHPRENLQSHTHITLTDQSLVQPVQLITCSPSVLTPRSTNPLVQVSELSPSQLVSSLPRAKNSTAKISVLSHTGQRHCGNVERSSRPKNVICRLVNIIKSGSLCGLNSSNSFDDECNGSQLKEISHSTSVQQRSSSLKPRSVTRRQTHLLPPFSSFSSDHLNSQITSPLRLPHDQHDKATEGIREVRSLLDLQREKERVDRRPSRYIEDIRVLHNIHRREMVSKLLYRESGQLFCRVGSSGDIHPPPPPNLLLSGPSPLPPVKRDFTADPPVAQRDRKKILQKITKQGLKKMSSQEVTEISFADSDFTVSCLKAHNLYRARHSAPPLRLSLQLCEFAQQWVNELAQTGNLSYRRRAGLGENLFCRNLTLHRRKDQSIPDITGEEVAAYWYSNVRQYRFSQPSGALHAQAGSFSQMVWVRCREFGVGKARSRTGKVVVVAYYFPAGNEYDKFKENVLPLNTRALAAEMLCQGQILMDQLLHLESEEEYLQSRRNSKAKMSDRMAMAVLSSQPPNIKGRNATTILAAQMLGHAATVITTPDDRLEVAIHVSKKSFKSTKKRDTDIFIPLSSKDSPIPVRRPMKASTKRVTSPADKPAVKLKSALKKKSSCFTEIASVEHNEGQREQNLTSVVSESKMPSTQDLKIRSLSDEALFSRRRSENRQLYFGSPQDTFSGDSVSAERTLSDTSNLTAESGTANEGSSLGDMPAEEYVMCVSSLRSKKGIRSCTSVNDQYLSNNKSSAAETDTADAKWSVNSSPQRKVSAGNDRRSANGGEASQTGPLGNTSPVSPNHNVHTSFFRCSSRKIRFIDKSQPNSIDSHRSATPDTEEVGEDCTSSTPSLQGSKVVAESGLNLPHGSPGHRSGTLNCYALSPLRY